MEVLKDNTALINQLSNVDGYKSFSSIEIGTCIAIRSIDLDENRVFINIKGRTTEEYYLIPFVLKKIVASNLYKKICAEELKTIIEYRGMVKHKKIEGIKYHNFKVVKILPRNGEEEVTTSQRSF